MEKLTVLISLYGISIVINPNFDLNSVSVNSWYVLNIAQTRTINIGNKKTKTTKLMMIPVLSASIKLMMGTEIMSELRSELGRLIEDFSSL
ncbi:hypothetical protein ABWK22_22950 [Gottfriedia acidiceleris]|uniref:hypothetical protein n=1 Tax=Bacillaceae TaxID=186817 RepID=UPI00257005CE|nr:hypothetical protein [Bacillus sp. AFS001701]